MNAGRKQMMCRRAFSALLLALALWLSPCASSTAAAGDGTNARPAQLRISGYGVLGDLRLKHMLKILQTGKTKPEFFSADFIEDAALLILSRLHDDGYQRPVIVVNLTLEDGRTMSHQWESDLTEPLPRPLFVRKVRFKIKEGPLYHFTNLEFSGLHSIPEKKARSYFVETGGLWSLKGNRIYSPDKLKRSAANLAAELERMGYQEASVTVTNVQIDHRSGAVQVRIEVEEGRQFIVRSVRQEVFYSGAPEPLETRTNWPARPYSKFWEQDFTQGIKTNYYHQGYPDTTVAVKIIGRDVQTNEVHLDLEARVETGLHIKVGDISFVGNRRTRDSVLERRVSLHEGDQLDRVEAEHGRYRLSRLGVFDSVELQYDNVNQDTRNVTYRLQEGKQIDVSLLFGYGSYELLRGGVQLDQYNVFGLAHHQELKLRQSFKASSADYTYTMPELFGENVDAFLNSSGLRREEVSWTRIEYGGGAGVRRFFRTVDTDLSVRYNYQILRAEGANTNAIPVGARDSTAGAIILDVNHDRRDNPLYPHRGYKFFSDIEVASDYLGGDANYQRLNLSLSFHHPIGQSQWVHVGLSHGLVNTVGSAATDLPFNKRFFPGGENSIRGYQDGEASPRDATGKIIGAETFLLGNLEFEQGITPSWSLVTFVDALGFAEQLKDYPADETLVSVGGGIRLKTFIGPIRLEYGYNLNPRPRDPMGTLQFSLGFPF